MDHCFLTGGLIQFCFDHDFTGQMKSVNRTGICLCIEREVHARTGMYLTYQEVQYESAGTFFESIGQVFENRW